jgi:hypothetical protein
MTLPASLQFLTVMPTTLTQHASPALDNFCYLLRIWPVLHQLLIVILITLMEPVTLAQDCMFYQ